MKAVHQHIIIQKEGLSAHPLFQELLECPRVEQALAFAPRITFWMMSCQDVLRLNAEHSQDPRYSALLYRQRSEAGDPELWFFLEDVAELTGQPLMPDSLWSRAHDSTRASYTLMGEVLRPLDDRLRILLVLALESTHQTFFAHLVPLVSRWGKGRKLQYLVDHHILAEQRLESFIKLVEAKQLDMGLTAELQEQALALVDRVYGAFRALLDALRTDVQGPARPKRHLSLVKTEGS